MMLLVDTVTNATLDVRITTTRKYDTQRDPQVVKRNGKDIDALAVKATTIRSCGR